MTPFLRAGIVLGLLSLIGPFAMDMYLPAMPGIGADLGTTTQAMQTTITAYMAAFGLGQLVYGPWADQSGRKPPLYVALVIFAIGSVVATFAPTVEWLILGRVVQGLGAAAMMVIPRAIVRDIATGEDATRLMALMMLVFSVSPMLAPLVGSGLMAVFGWRSVFVALGATTILSLLLLYFLQPETLPPSARRRASVAEMRTGLWHLLRHRGFVVLTALGAAGLASFFIFLAAAPFVYTGHFGLSPVQFSLAFAVNAMAFIGVGQLAGPLMGRFGAGAVMRGAAALFALAAIANAALAFAGILTLPLVMGLLALGNAGLGLIIPTSMVQALEEQGEHAGLASSIGGTFQMVVGGGLTAALGAVLTSDPVPMLVAIAACAVTSLGLALIAPSQAEAANTRRDTSSSAAS